MVYTSLHSKCYCKMQQNQVKKKEEREALEKEKK